jgi:hypothetical protein
MQDAGLQESCCGSYPLEVTNVSDRVAAAVPAKSRLILIMIRAV